MHRNLLLAALACAFALGIGSVSAQTGHDHGSMMKPREAQSAKPALAEGEVRKVDRTKGTVTLRHGPLEALGMGPMTMQFVATDPKLLAGVKEGDKVRFEPAQGKDGTLLVSRLEVIK